MPRSRVAEGRPVLLRAAEASSAEASLTYLDWAATTPLCEEAASAMAPYMVGGVANLAYGGNANSLHSVGRSAFAAMEQARRDLAECLGCRPDELVFTSGATESNNMAIHGLVEREIERRGKHGFESGSPHVVTCSIEHEAVLEPMHVLERKGVRVTSLAPDAGGFISPQRLREAMCEDTVLVSVMTANNEIGAVNLVGELAAAAHETGALFHTDATQAFGKIAFSCSESGVDAASFSAHKICGPKGVGALYLRKGLKCPAYMRGGGQESGARSGTQNVVGMVGFAAAASALAGNAERLEAEALRLTELRDDLYSFFRGYSNVQPSVPCDRGSRDYLPNIVHVNIDGLESETAILRLDREGICVSGGSACSSKSLGASRILTELGVTGDRAMGALRISMGRYTTAEDIDTFKRAFHRLMEWAGL